MKITDIYSKYEIMPKLQLHMFRVAGVASVICDNFSEPLHKDSIVSACLLHDIGNVVKFDFSSKIFPEIYFSPKGKNYWRKIKKKFEKKYGTNDHLTTDLILKEVGVFKKVYNLVHQMGFPNTQKVFDSGNFELKIVAYSDQRVSPAGIVSMEERYKEAAIRYANKIKHNFTPEMFSNLANLNKEIEKQIFSKCKIKPKDVTTSLVEPFIENLKNFDIKIMS